jgi:DNA topoisomerase III
MEVLKDKGLGTPATRTSILETLIHRGYASRDKTHIRATANGGLLIKELRKLAPGYTSAQQTAEWELQLQKMKKGDPTAPTREKFLDALLAQFEKEKPAFLAVKAASVVKSAVSGVSCPRTGGAIYDCGKYFMAEGFPKLRFFKEILGHTFSAVEFASILEGNLQKKEVYFKLKSTKTGKDFESAFKLNADESKLEFALKSRDASGGGTATGTGLKCPKSGKEVMDNGGLLLFPGFPTIRFYKQMFGKKFTDKELVDLVKSNVAGLPMEWELYSEKSKKTYKAKIVIDEKEQKLKLSFNN